MATDNKNVMHVINNTDTHDAEKHHEITVDVPGAYEVEFLSNLTIIITLIKCAYSSPNLTRSGESKFGHIVILECKP